jgi:hypothetical protein
MKQYWLGVIAGFALSAPVAVMAADAPKPAEETKLVAPAVVEAMGKLVEQGVQVASPSLQKGDDFEPYGVLQLKDGSLQYVGYQKPNPPPENPPPAMEIFKRVTLTVLDATRKNPDIVAAATFASSSSTTSDGKTMVPMIRAEVDHRDGTPLLILIPFQREKDGKLVFGSTPSLPGTNFLFFREQAAAAPAAAAAPVSAAPAAPAKAKAK